MVLSLLGLSSIGIGLSMSLRAETVCWEGVGPWVLGVSFLFLGYVIGRQRNRARPLELHFFERGMSYELDGTEVAFRWSDVHTYLEPHLHRRGWRGLSARFARADGRTHRLRVNSNQITQLRRLQFEISLGCARAHRDEARLAWQRGEAIAFGKLQVSREYLGCGNIRIAWTDVDEARVVGGRLRVRRKGRRLDWVLRLGEIPNVPVLMDVIQDHLSSPAEFSDLTTTFGTSQT